MENPTQADAAPRPLEYAARPVPGRVFSWSIFVATAAVCWALLAFFAMVVPRFKQMYVDMKVRLPAVSQVMLDLSDLVLTDFGWALLLLLPFVLAVLFRKRAIRGRWARLIFLVFYFGMAILAILALFMPMISLIEGISGSSSGR